MYIPSHFAASDAGVRAMLTDSGLVQLITPTAAGLVATPLPLLYDEAAGTLLGHVARNNDHWRRAPEATGESLAIITARHDYISPSWYASKAEHGRVVPTWNYATVQVFGELVVHEDVEWLRALVTRLTDREEARITHPWSVTDAPEAFIAGQLRAIVGLELRISRVEGKAKLSQNRSDADRAGVRAALGPEALLDPGQPIGTSETVPSSATENPGL